MQTNSRMSPNIINVLIVDGTLSLTDFDGNIEIKGDEVIVNEKTSLKVIYRSTPKSQRFNLKIKASLDLYEFYEMTQDFEIAKTIDVFENVNLNRYVENRIRNNPQANIEETVIVHGSSVKCAYLDLGYNKSENKIQYILSKPGSYADIHLGALSDGSKKYYDIAMVHTSGHTYGNMDNYGIVKNKGSLIIDGTGKITEGSAKSNTHQVNKIIVFDHKCQAQANPYLLVDEYDVNASHGASVGKIDDEQLFYLQSRGLSSHEAMSLVTIGYFMPVINYINDETIKEDVTNLLKERVIM